MEGEAATAAQDLGIRRLEASCWIYTAPYSEPTHVDALFWSVGSKAFKGW